MRRIAQSYIAAVDIIVSANTINYMAGVLLVIPILFGPLLLVAVYIMSIGFGVSLLAKGYRRDDAGNRDKKRIAAGWVLIGQFLAMTIIVIAIICLIPTYFRAHPIAFM